jgi:hypothetical protein
MKARSSVTTSSQVISDLVVLISSTSWLDPPAGLTYDRPAADTSFQSMHLRLHVLALVVASLSAAGVASVFGQSLGDVSRKEEARRKDVKQPSKVYTNKDLGGVVAGSEPPPSTDPSKPSTASTTAERDNEKDKSAKATDQSASGEKKDQAYWSGRMKGIAEQLQHDETFAEALQSRINGLTADFSARDDPAQRAVIGKDRQKALDELARLKKAIDSDKKAVADLEEEARRAGVPPGWLR